jgi:hypothetical protein
MYQKPLGRVNEVSREERTLAAEARVTDVFGDVVV